MSRVGKQPILIPDNVTVELEDNRVNVKGPKGNLSLKTYKKLNLNLEGKILTINRTDDEKSSLEKFGLTRTLINNMVVGVIGGFEKKLEVNGVGFKVNVIGKELKLNLGYSHEVDYIVPDDIDVSVEQNIITIAGIDNQKVGQVAAEIRTLRKPEPYKGKGIKYVGERIIRKSGKAGKEKV